MFNNFYATGLRNITASTIQGKQSFWNDVSEDKMWENKQIKKQESQAELHSVRPQQQRYIERILSRHMKFFWGFNKCLFTTIIV